MSELRITFRGKDIDKKISIFKEEDGCFDKLVIGEHTYKVWSAFLNTDFLFFETGISLECCEIVEEMQKDIAMLLPDEPLSVSYFSTRTSCGWYYSFGYMNNEYSTWGFDKFDGGVYE